MADTKCSDIDVSSITVENVYADNVQATYNTTHTLHKTEATIDASSIPSGDTVGGTIVLGGKMDDTSYTIGLTINGVVPANINLGFDSLLQIGDSLVVTIHWVTDGSTGAYLAVTAICDNVALEASSGVLHDEVTDYTTGDVTFSISNMASSSDRVAIVLGHSGV